MNEGAAVRRSAESRIEYGGRIKSARRLVYYVRMSAALFEGDAQKRTLYSARTPLSQSLLLTAKIMLTSDEP